MFIPQCRPDPDEIIESGLNYCKYQIKAQVIEVPQLKIVTYPLVLQIYYVVLKRPDGWYNPLATGDHSQEVNLCDTLLEMDFEITSPQHQLELKLNQALDVHMC